MRRLRPESFAFTLLLGALGALPPLSIDMALPALPQLGADFHVSVAAAAWTLSLFMAGFGVAQLVFGPLSERFGRRPILIVGCALFTLASFACAFAPSLPLLLAARFVEGCGAGAGMAMTFAIVRDLFEGATARTRLSYVSLVVNVAPMIAPTLGALILLLAPWRAIYGALGVGGLAVAAAIVFGLDESHRAPDADALSLSSLAGNYARVLGNRVALGNILVGAFSFGCMFSYVAGSSGLMMHRIGLTPSGYGVTFACTALGIMAGSFLSGQISRRRLPATLPMWSGLGLALATALALLVLTLVGAVGLSTFLPLLVLNCLCFGLVAPNAAHGALHPLPEVAGVAGATLGFVQMIGGALASAAVAHFDSGRDPVSMTGTMSVCALMAIAIYAVWVRPAEGADPLAASHR